MVDASAAPANEPWVTCLSCGRLVRVEAKAAQTAPRPGVPKSITVSNAGGELRIVRRWFLPAAWFLVVFCGIWDTAVLTFIGSAMASGEWGSVLFASLHATVGLLLSYLTIALFANTTRISVRRGELDVRHGPLPWLGNGTYPVRSVRQLFTKEKVTTNKNGQPSRSYEVHFIDTDSNKKKLLVGLPDPQQAWFIESEIERHLGIEDVPVEGEHRSRTAEEGRRRRGAIAQNE